MGIFRQQAPTVHPPDREPNLGSWQGRLFIAAYLAAGGLALWRLWCSEMLVDYAVCGLLGLAMLRGEFPLFFYGQDFMGSLDGTLSAPLFALWGPNALTLGFWSPVLWLLTIGVLHRLLKMFFAPVGVWAGVTLLCLPPAMAMCWSGQAQTHYPLGIFLSGSLLYLTAILWKNEKWGAWLPFLWGLCTGLALWTNFQTAVVILPSALFLFLSRWRCVFGPGGLGLALGVGVGAAPLIYYNLTHALVHGEQVRGFTLDQILPRLKPLVGNALPLILGFNPFMDGGQLVLNSSGFWLFAALLALLFWGMAAMLGQTRTKGHTFLWVPVLVILTNIAILLLTSYGKVLFKSDQRYLLPLYLGLPFVWAWLAQWLGQRRTWLGVGLTVALAALHLGFYYANLYCATEFRCSQGGHFTRAQERQDRFNQILRTRGWRHVYSDDSLTDSFLSGDDPVFVQSWQDRRAKASALVDAALAPVFKESIGRSLDFMGTAYSRCPSQECIWEILHSIKEPTGVERLLPREVWSARDLQGRDLGGDLNDWDLGSGWSSGRAAGPGQGLVLDLGREQEVAGLVLIAGDPLLGPSGLSVETAGQGEDFTLVRKGKELPREPVFFSGPHPFRKARYGRVEVYFPKRRIRWLRLTHVGASRRPWEVGELLLYGPGVKMAKTDWAARAGALAASVGTANLEQVAADAWTAAVLRSRLGPRPRTVIANFTQDDYGNGAMETPLLPFLHPGPRSGLVVEPRFASAAAQALTRAGVSFLSKAVGGMRLFILNGLSTPGNTLPIKSITSHADHQAAAQLASGIPKAGRWGSQAPQKAGMHLTLDLGRVREVGGFVLFAPTYPMDSPRGLKVLASEGGRVWRRVPARLVWPLVMAGPLPLALGGSQSRYRLDQPVQTRFLKLEVTGSHPVWWWSVESLKVTAP